MHVTVSLAGRCTEVEVGEDCRSLTALKTAVVTALPQLRTEASIEGFDLIVGGCAADEDTALGLEDGTDFEVVLNTRGAALIELCARGERVSEERLVEAIYYDDRGDSAELCGLLIDAGVTGGPDSTGSSRFPGATALHVAVMPPHGKRVRDNYTLCKLLLDRGHPVRDLEYNGRTPLLMAVGSGHVDVCKLLVERGHSVQCTFNQATLLHWLGRCGRGYTVRYGHERQYGIPSCGVSDLCWLFLQNGVAAQCMDKEQQTPLHLAAGGGAKFVGMCDMLLDRGHELQCVDGQGKTPLHHAATAESDSICRILLFRGHELECVDNNGDTPLHYAARTRTRAWSRLTEKQLEICQVLLDHGHSVQCVNHKGETPLDVASCPEISALLCGKSAPSAAVEEPKVRE
eukprot:Rhum_TRINITY_DN4637_c0_g1::Rhum_TRINITY_DN4637_c0_g1_i1::g.15161::m.15161